MDSKDDFIKMLINTELEDDAELLFNRIKEILENQSSSKIPSYRYRRLMSIEQDIELCELMLSFYFMEEEPILKYNRKAIRYPDFMVRTIWDEYEARGLNLKAVAEETKIATEEDEKRKAMIQIVYNIWNPPRMEKEDITEEQVRNKISELKKQYNELKKGLSKKRERKNDILYSIINDCFKKYNKTNSVYRQVFKCLDFFELIDEEMKATWRKTESRYAKEAYIKFLFRECKKMG